MQEEILASNCKIKHILKSPVSISNITYDMIHIDEQFDIYHIPILRNGTGLCRELVKDTSNISHLWILVIPK